MATNYPSSLDNFTNPTNGDKLDSPSHSLQHADANDALEAIETKLGIGASAAGSAVAGYSLIHEAGGTTSWGPIVSIDGGSTILSTDADIEPLILQGGTPEIATVGSVSANGTTITYTASNTFTAGQAVRITGVNPAQFNFDRAVLATAGTGNFTVTNAGTGTYVSGGTAILYQGNLQEWKDYEGNVVASVDQFGKSNLGGLVHINTTSFSAVASQSFDNVFSATYDDYKILATLSSSTDSEVLIRLRASGSDNTTASAWNSQRLFVGSTTVTGSTENKNYLSNLPIRNSDFNAIDMTFYRPNLTSATLVTLHSIYGASGGQITLFSASNSVLSAFDGFTISKASGTLTGVISIYGYRKS